MFECYDDDAHNDGDVDTKPTFDPAVLINEYTSSFINSYLKQV